MSPEVLAINLKEAVKGFSKYATKVDAIAFSGSSGCAIAFAIAMKYKLPLIYVRKKNEKSHGSMVECNCTDPIYRYMIVDDFTYSGKTVQHIVSSVAKVAKKGFAWEGPECVGVYAFDTEAQTDTILYMDDGKVLNIYTP